MIKIIRQNSPPQQFFELDIRKNQQAAIDAWLNSSLYERGTRPYLDVRHEEIPELKQWLLVEFNAKCAYCETPLTVENGHISFFRPLREALQDRNGEGSKNHYFWLMWEWSNLYLSCHSCRNAKGFLFPVINRRANLGTYNPILLLRERPLLLDPFLDDPNQYLEFREDGTVNPIEDLPDEKRQRSKKTIEILDLNREKLRTVRAEHADELKKLWQELLKETSRDESSEFNLAPYIERLKAEIGADRPYAGMKQQLLKRWIDGQFLGESTPAVNKLLNISYFIDLKSKLESWMSQAKAASIEPTRDVAKSSHVLPRSTSPLDLRPIDRRQALLVGVNNYEDTSIPNLKNCVNDVLALRELLESLDYVVHGLHDQVEDEKLYPTQSNIKKKLVEICYEAKGDDLLWIYFAGHGKQTNGKPVLLTRDTSFSNIIETGLSVADIEELMRISAARRMILTIDACEAGIDVGRSGPDSEEFIRRVYELAEGFVVMAACTAQQTARESPDEPHGLFTSFLLKGLKGEADSNGNNFVTVNDIYTFVTDNQRKHSEQTNILQEPTIQYEGIGDMILADFREISKPM